jgi:ADP-ribosyl-[dinitrogen reductase] hydrolase
MTFCPGKTDLGAATGAWERDLNIDLDAAVAWGASAVISLIEDHEFDLLKVPGLGSAVEAKGMRWFHLPIRDVKPPDSRFTGQWSTDGPLIHQMLREVGNVVLHCRGGLGRTGTVAAQILVEMGIDPVDAISEVRQARRGAIETTEQKDYVLGLRN